jgi:prepilin-type processing-associated H-X9-DG protein
MHRHISLCFTALAMIQAQQPDRAPDLSTPEAAIRSFVSTFLNGHFRQAAQCIESVVIQSELAELEAEFKKDSVSNKVELPITAITVELDGDTAKAHVKYGAPRWEDAAAEETVRLVRRGSDWKVLPFGTVDLYRLGQQKSGKLALPPVGSFAFSLSFPRIVIAQSRAIGSAEACSSNIRQLSLAAHMLAQDHKDRYAIKASSYKKSLAPYLKNGKVFVCPSDKAGPRSYSFNTSLQGVADARVKRPDLTVFFYEGKGGKLDYRHEGTAAVAFVDGSVKMIGPEGAKKLRWKP